jgi:hypothetical protein
MHVLEHTSYKDFLREVVDEGLATGSELARAARVQPPYISTVLRRDAHLSLGQAHAIAAHLRLAGEELDYFLLLVQEATSDRPEHARHVRARLERVRAEHRRIKGRYQNPSVLLGPSADTDRLLRYYLDCHYQTAHMLIRQPAYQNAPEKLAARLRLEPAQIVAVLSDLEALGLITRRGQHCQPTSAHTHIEDGSLLSRENHRSWRVDALGRTMRPSAGDYRFSGTFSATSAAKERLIRALMSELARHRDAIQDDRDEAVYQVNLDVYSPA